MTKDMLEELSRQDIETIDRGELRDITAVTIRQDLPQSEKLLAFFKEIKNPYCFRCGETPVRICFSETGPTLEKALQDYFIRIKQG